MEPNFSERTLKERLNLAENEIANIYSTTSKSVDPVAWRKMVEALPKILDIIRSHKIFEDRKSIFALIACYLGYTNMSDICMTRGQVFAAYLLIWVIAGQSPKGAKSDSKEAEIDPIYEAMKRSTSVVQKYYKSRKRTSPMTVYYHEEFDATEILLHEVGSEPFINELRSQLERIKPKQDRGLKRPASTDYEGESPQKRIRYSSESTSEVSTPDSNPSEVSNDPSPRDGNVYMQSNPIYVYKSYHAYPPIVPNANLPYAYEYSNNGTYNTNHQEYTNYSGSQHQNVHVNYDTHVDTYQPYPNQCQAYAPPESEMFGDVLYEVNQDQEYDMLVNWLLLDNGNEQQFLNRFEYLTSMYDSVINNYSPSE